MSICPSPHRGCPTTRDYERQATIPKEHRCIKCEGLGTVRVRYSSPGYTDKDWHECLNCQGTGKKEIIL